MKGPLAKKEEIVPRSELLAALSRGLGHQTAAVFLD
jgi:hypothetical protein